MNETPRGAVEPLADDRPADDRTEHPVDDPDMLQRFAALYPELQRLARAKLRREGTFTLLDTGALVHESFLRLAARGDLSLADRPAFWGYAPQVMRSVIVDHARARLTQRRGERAEHVALDTWLGERLAQPESEVIEINEALRVLEQAEPRLARVHWHAS